MSKLAAFLAAVALLGAAVLAVVSLDLAAELEATRTRVTELEEALSDVAERAGEGTGRTGERREEARLRALEDRLARLETRRAEPAATAVPGDEEGAAAPAALVAGGTEIERAVEQVLEAREAERRLERRGQLATRGAERLLRDVEVSDEQRGQVEALFADYVRRVSEMRDQELDAELATERAAELRGELRRGLESVLDATQMETVGPRVERRMGDDGRRRGGRRQGPRRAGQGDGS